MSAFSRRLDGVCVALVTSADATCVCLVHVRGRVVHKFALSRVDGAAVAVSGAYGVIDAALALFCVRRGLLEILLRRRRLTLFDVFALVSRRTDMRAPIVAAAVVDNVAANGFKVRRSEPTTRNNDDTAGTWAVRMSDGATENIIVSAMSKTALFDVFANADHSARINFAAHNDNQFSGATNIIAIRKCSMRRTSSTTTVNGHD